MERDLAILLLEDDASWALLVREMLTGMPGLASLTHCSVLREGLALLEQRSFDVVLLDLNFNDSPALATLASVRQHFPHVAIVVLTDLAGEEMGLAAVRMGAQDYLTKGEVQRPLLHRVIRYAAERHYLQHQLDEARQTREVRSVERLSAPVSPQITSQYYAGFSLRDAYPAEFETLTASYRGLLARCLEERIYQTSGKVAARVPEMAAEFALLRSGPRDVLDVHMAALTKALKEEPRNRSQALLEEGRILVLNLMGHLAAFYRNYYPASARKGV